MGPVADRGSGAVKSGVLVMAYGTPERLEDVGAYYAHPPRSPPSADQLSDLLRRYEAVGGPTALNRITRAQADGLSRALVARGRAAPVYTGFKHVAPFVGEAVRQMAADGIDRAVGIVLAPHYSLRSIAEYERYAEEARPPGLELEVIPAWYDDTGFVGFLAGRLRSPAAGRRPRGSRLHAHSVPARAIDQGDPYPAQLEEACELVASRAGVERWRLAYQSAGRTDEVWLGPDVLEVIESIADHGARGGGPGDRLRSRPSRFSMISTWRRDSGRSRGAGVHTRRHAQRRSRIRRGPGRHRRADALTLEAVLHP